MALRFGLRSFFLCLGLAVTALLSGCGASSADVVSPSEIPSVDTSYHLVPGDKVRVNIFGERDLSGEFEVDGDGTVNLVLVGKVKAEGLTAEQLEQQLVERYSQGFLVNPKINVEVYDQRPYYVVGEVNKPGNYAISSGLTVRAAIANAGDYSYRANKSVVYLRRAGQSKEYPIDPDSEIYVAPGDTIRVGERYF